MRALAYTRDSSTIVTVTEDKTWRVRDAATAKGLRRFDYPAQLVGVAVSPGGDRVALAAQAPDDYSMAVTNSTPLPPILLNSVGLHVFDVRILNGNAIRTLARFLGKYLPKQYRKKGPARVGLELRKGPASQQALFEIDGKKTGTG